MIREMEPGLWQVRGWLVNHYILIKGEDVWIIDGGFVGDFRQIELVLKRVGLDWMNVKGLLMTHGHLDHTYNVGKILMKAPQAEVYGHPLDEDHFKGGHRYSGVALGCAFLEWLGRLVFGYEPVELTHEIVDGEILEAWGGLQVVHCPGHTLGHCGFLAQESGLFFSGDLFANWLLMTIKPWPWLNSCPEQFKASYKKVLALEMKGLLTNHCDKAIAEKQLERFRKRFGSGSSS